MVERSNQQNLVIKHTKRTNRLAILFTDDEYEKIMDDAYEMNMGIGPYVRYVLMKYHDAKWRYEYDHGKNSGG